MHIVYFDSSKGIIDLYVNGVKRLRQHNYWNDTNSIEYFRFIAFSDTSIEGAVVDNVEITTSPNGVSGRTKTIKMSEEIVSQDNKVGQTY